MGTKEILEEKAISFKNGESKANGFNKWATKRDEILSYLLDNSRELDTNYQDIKPLQRLHFILGDRSIEHCPYCNKPRSWRNFQKGYNKTCGDSQCKSKESLNSIKKHNIKNYGVDYFFQTDEFKTKFKETSLKNHGVDNPSKSHAVIEKIKQTNLENFGVSNWLKVKKNRENISQKIERSHKNKRDNIIRESNIPIEEVKYDLEKNKVTILCKKCNSESIFSGSFYKKKINIAQNPCLICNPPLKQESKGEIELYEFIAKNYSGRIIKNYKVEQGNKEIDIFLPEINVGFEFDGVYWHSEIFKGKRQNLNKKIQVEANGIRLYNIWEDLWISKNEIVKSRVLNILGNTQKIIYGRKCHIKQITPKEEKEFLLGSHLQGYVPSKIKIGLFLEDELVGLMTFGNRRKALGSANIQNQYELLRYCSKINTKVIGGASKLFKHFLCNYEVDSVISYQDNSWGMGNLYQNLGFKLEDKPKPNYWWCKGNLRFHRYNFRKDLLIKKGHDPQKTESQIMTEEGYYKLWDYGNYKWIFTNKEP